MGAGSVANGSRTAALPSPRSPLLRHQPHHSSYRCVAAPQVRTKLKSGGSVEVAAKKIPMIDLPLGATEDRVCGTIDIEKALTEGVKAFEPGLLAK